MRHKIKDLEGLVWYVFWLHRDTLLDSDLLVALLFGEINGSAIYGHITVI
jgi:hypothetical protein